MPEKLKNAKVVWTDGDYSLLLLNDAAQTLVWRQEAKEEIPVGQIIDRHGVIVVVREDGLEIVSLPSNITEAQAAEVIGLVLDAAFRLKSNVTIHDINAVTIALQSRVAQN